MRYFWKGTISFGLINIPIGLVSASKEHSLRFKLLHQKDLSEIRYARICKKEDIEVPYSQIVKGIEKNGRYVVMQEEDFKKAETETSKNIEIISFCDEQEINSIYYDMPYFIQPQKTGEKAYYLLHKALQKTGKIALVNYNLRNRNHIAAIKIYKNLLVLNQMRYESQIIDTEKFDLITNIRVAPKELEMAEKLIEQLSTPFEPEQFHDTYIEDLEHIIAKRAGKGKVLKKAQIKAGEEKLAEVYDIMSLLKASLNEKKTRTKKKA
jgi:DNA end-binding protein Ku